MCVLLGVLAAVVAGCTMPSMKIRPMHLTLPEGDDSYNVGFRDGCDSALGIVAAGPVASTHEFSMDVNRGIQDKQYSDGYRMGTNYCTYFSDPGPI
jgi:hypothetical protein